MDNAGGIAILVLVVLVVWLWRRGGGATRNAERQLRRICFGNDAQVERLIDFEMTRTPAFPAPRRRAAPWTGTAATTVEG